MTSNIFRILFVRASKIQRYVVLLYLLALHSTEVEDTRDKREVNINVISEKERGINSQA